MTEHEVTLSGHPRATRQIELARGWGAIGAFLLTAWLSHRAGVPGFDTCLRALGAGIAGYLVCWALAVQVWRHLAVAELKAARADAVRRREEAAAAAAPNN